MCGKAYDGLEVVVSVSTLLAVGTSLGESPNPTTEVSLPEVLQESWLLGMYRAL